jgi:hypothetical protein
MPRGRAWGVCTSFMTSTIGFTPFYGVNAFQQRSQKISSRLTIPQALSLTVTWSLQPQLHTMTYWPSQQPLPSVQSTHCPIMTQQSIGKPRAPLPLLARLRTYYAFRPFTPGTIGTWPNLVTFRAGPTLWQTSVRVFGTLLTNSFSHILTPIFLRTNLGKFTAYDRR